MKQNFGMLLLNCEEKEIIMIKKLYIKSNPSVKEKWLNLLMQEGIREESTLDETYGYYNDEDELIATASRYQNVIKCVAVDSTYQGGSLFNEIISHVMNQNVQEGFFKHYVYTKPGCKKGFEYLGFHEIESVDHTLVFMEKAITGFDVFIKNLESLNQNAPNTAAIVMNANPFTLGHQFLVEKAASESKYVYVFVLSEEMSAFKAAQRIELVRQGTAHLKNVKVLPTENYMVSSATFPSYFLKEDDDVTFVQARLDARVFAHHIAPALNITKRYVGSEPFSNATNIYNEALQEEFKGKLDLEIVNRIGNEESIISATKVRSLLAEENLDAVRPFVPETTFAFFISEEGRQVIAALKGA